MNTVKVDLISNGSATSDWKGWPGGKGSLAVVGTFGGASIKLQFLGPDDLTPIDVELLDSSGAFVPVPVTAAGAYVFELPDVPIRAVVTGGTPSGLYVQARRTLG